MRLRFPWYLGWGGRHLVRAQPQALVDTPTTLTGEGWDDLDVGYGKSKLLPLEHGEEGVKLMRRVKAAFDPDGIMNPGKILPKRLRRNADEDDDLLERRRESASRQCRQRWPPVGRDFLELRVIRAPSRLRREASRMPARARQSRNVPVSYPRCPHILSE